MSEMRNEKRLSTDRDEPSTSKQRKRQVSKDTFYKWQRKFEREHQTSTWLRCALDEKDRELVSILWCDVCRKFKERITGLKNFSTVWIDGSTNHKTSNVFDHARSNPHKAAMIRLREEQAKCSNEPVTSYSTIARSLLSPPLDEAVKKRSIKTEIPDMFCNSQGVLTLY